MRAATVVETIVDVDAQDVTAVPVVDDLVPRVQRESLALRLDRALAQGGDDDGDELADRDERETGGETVGARTRAHLLQRRAHDGLNQPIQEWQLWSTGSLLVAPALLPADAGLCRDVLCIP